MGCGSTGGGGQTSTVVQQSSPPPDFLAAYRALQSRATGVANQPLQQYGGPMVAGFTPAQLTAFDTVNNAQGVGAPFTNAAATMAGNAATPIADNIPLLSDATDASLAGSGARTLTSAAPNYWRSAMASIPMLLAATGLGGSPAYASGNPGVGSPPSGISGAANPGVGGGPTANTGLIQSFENPYTNDVVNTTLANMDRSNAIQHNDLTGNAIASGAWGGDRAGVASAELDRTQALARAQTEAQLRSAGYSQGLGAAQNMTAQELQGLGLATGANQSQDQANVARAIAGLGAYGTQLSAAEQAAATTGGLNLGAGQLLSGLGSQAQNQALTGASAQLSSGALQQQLAQEQLNIPFQQFQAAQNYPFYTTNFLGQQTGLAGGLAGGTQSTTSPGPSMLSQLGGLGMTGLGLYNSGALSGLGGLLSSGASGLGGLLGFGGTAAAADAAAGGLGAASGGEAIASLLPFLALAKRGGRIGVGEERAHGGGIDAGVGGDVSILRRPQGGVGYTPVAIPQVPLRASLPVTSGTPGASLSIDPVSNWSPPAPVAPAAGVGDGTAGYNPADPGSWNFPGMPATAISGMQPGVGEPGGQLYPNQASRGNTPLQDIRQAMAIGLPISDMSWAQAGLPPGGGDVGAALMAQYANGAGVGTGAMNPNPLGRRYARVGYADGGSDYDEDDAAFLAPDLPGVGDVQSFDVASATPGRPRAPFWGYGVPHGGTAARGAAPNAGLGTPAMAADLGADPTAPSGLTDSAWMPLIQAGLATMAGNSPYALTNFGQGGLYGIKAMEEQKAANEAKAEKQKEFALKQSEADARAKEIDAQIENWRNTDERAREGTWSHNNEVDEDGHYVEVNSRTGETRQGPKAGALPESEGTKEERAIQRKNGENTAAYQKRMLDLREKEIEQGKYTWQPGMGPDPSDPTKQVAGSWRFPTKSDEDPKFIPGVVLTGKPGAAGGNTALEKNAKFYVDNGIAPDLATAVKMLRTGVNDGAVFQRLVQAEKKIILTNNYGMADADAEKMATANVKARIGSSAEPAPAAAPAKGATPAAIPPRPAALPPGSQWSPSRQQWRDPSNKIYDANGNPV